MVKHVIKTFDVLKKYPEQLNIKEKVTVSLLKK